MVLCESCLEFSEPLKSVHLCLSANSGNFYPYSDIFSALASPFGIPGTHVKSFDIVPQVTGSIIINFLCFSYWIISITISSNSLILFPVISVMLLSLSIKS